MQDKNKIKLVQLTNKVYYLEHHVETDRPILGAIVGTKATLLVDSGNSPGHAKHFLSELEKNNIQNLEHLFITHFHWDHIFGIATLNIPATSTEKTAYLSKKMGQYDWTFDFVKHWNQSGKLTDFATKGFMIEREEVFKKDIKAPEIVFKDKKTIDLGGVTAQLVHVGGQHADDSAVCYIPEEKVLFCGDCLYANMLTDDFRYNFEQLKITFSKLNEFDADYYLLSHQEVMTKEEYGVTKQTFFEVGEAVEKHGMNTHNVVNEILLNSSLGFTTFHKEIIPYFQNELIK